MIKIRCVIDHITYQNQENGYSVMKVKVKDYKDPVTLVGNLLHWRFDPSARIMMPADEITFVIPAVRLGKMLQTMRYTCLFDTPAWGKIRQRI